MSPAGPERGWGHCGERIGLAYKLARELGLGPVEREVLVNLAWHANDAERMTWPSQAAIAADVGRSQSTVREALAELIKGGIIELARRRSGPGRGNRGEHGRTNAYSLTFLPEEKTEPTRRSFSPDAPKERRTDVKERRTDVKERRSQRPDQGKREREYHIEDHIEHRTKNTRTLARRNDSSSVVEPLPSAAVHPLGAVEVEPEGFREFWSAYPRKVARGEALKSYRRALERDGPVPLVVGLRAWVAYWQADGTDTRFVPHPTTWLNQSRYLDNPPPVTRRANEPRGYAGMREYLRRRGPQ